MMKTSSEDIFLYRCLLTYILIILKFVLTLNLKFDLKSPISNIQPLFWHPRPCASGHAPRKHQVLTQKPRPLDAVFLAHGHGTHSMSAALSRGR